MIERTKQTTHTIDLARLAKSGRRYPKVDTASHEAERRGVSTEDVLFERISDDLRASAEADGSLPPVIWREGGLLRFQILAAVGEECPECHVDLALHRHKMSCSRQSDGGLTMKVGGSGPPS